MRYSDLICYFDETKSGIAQQYTGLRVKLWLRVHSSELFKPGVFSLFYMQLFSNVIVSSVSIDTQFDDTLEFFWIILMIVDSLYNIQGISLFL